MGLKEIRFQLLKALQGLWSAKNPVLMDGEPAFEENNGNFYLKVGDGTTQYNGLKYVSLPYNLNGEIKPIEEVVFMILNPYQVPVISGVTNNAIDGAYGNIKVFEIGDTLSNPVIVRWNKTNNDNILSASNSGRIVVNGANIFTGDGYFNLKTLSEKTLLVSTPFKPSVLTEVIISVSGTDIKGTQLIPAISTIRFDGRLRWGKSNLESFTSEAQLTSLLYSKLTNNIKGTYDFPASSGYSYMAIPTTFDQVSMDIRLGYLADTPNSYDMYPQSTLVSGAPDLVNINRNGVIIPHRIYRSTTKSLASDQAIIK